jgi:hypothetical protein
MSINELSYPFDLFDCKLGAVLVDSALKEHNTCI